jgi:MFS family permease
MNKRERHILITTCYGHFMSHYNMLVFPAVALPLTLRLQMNLADVLAISFWMYLLFGLSALPWGLVADRWGAPFLIPIYYFGAGLSGFAAAYWLDSSSALAYCLASIGLFSGIYHPAGLGLISKEIERVSVGMGVNGMFGNLGLAAAPFITGIVNWFWGPRATYLTLGGLNLFGIVLLIIYPLELPKSHSSGKVQDNNGNLGAFMILLMAMMLGGVAYRGATVITPAYFELKGEGIYRGLLSLLGEGMSTNLVATSITSIIFIVGMIGQYIGGRVADRFHLQRSYLVFHAFTVPVAFFIAFATDWSLILLAMIYFFFLLGMQPIENTLVGRFTPAKFRHSAFGMKFILTFGVGALAVKIVEGMERGYGIETVFPTLGAVSIGLILFILVLIKKTD